MGITLILLGVGCIIGAIVGGGVKLSHLEIAKFSSIWRQLMLAVFGLVILLIGITIQTAPDLAAPTPQRVEAEAADAVPAQSAAGGNSADGEARPQPVAEPDGEAQPQPVAGPVRHDVSGVWTDADQNRIRFDLAQGLAFVMLVGDSDARRFRAEAIANGVAWGTASDVCTVTLAADGRTMDGWCTDQEDGSRTRAFLTRSQE